MAQRFFTLLDCCPTIYWEHGAGADAEVQRELAAEWQAEDKALRLTKQYLEQAKSVLQSAGVPASQIRIRPAIEEDSLIGATIAELTRGKYSGVIISSQHADAARSRADRPTPAYSKGRCVGH